MSSPRRGSPSPDQPGRTDDHTPDLENSESARETDTNIGCQWRTDQYQDGECSRFLDCPSHSIEREESAHPNESAPSPPPPEADTVSTNTTTTDDEPNADRDSVEDRLASQLRLLGTRFGASDQGVDDVQGGDAGPSTTLDQPLPPLPLPRSTSHMVPLQHPIDLNHSLPPTPREEHAEQELPVTAPRSDRRRSTVTFRDDTVDEQASSSRTSTARNYNLERQGSLPTVSQAGHRTSQSSTSGTHDADDRSQSEFVLPRWQPDAEVTYCPICQTQFSIFVRKHHCRKCGRVVCNSCSPHRIIIPHQYIVRPPGSEDPLPQGFLYDGVSAAGYMDVTGPSGGERVRLCNPCVPDPQTAPPQSPGGGVTSGGPRSAHQRSRSSYTGTYGAATPSSRYPGSYGDSRGGDLRRYSAGTRSIMMAPGGRAGSSGSSSRMVHHGSLQRFSQPGSSYPARHSSLASAASSSRNRMLPPTLQIAEEDECPICHRELPSRDLPNVEAAREAHINACIQSHSTYGSPRAPASGRNEPAGPAPTARMTGMYKYVATEKDCIDDAECTICLEEFAVGVGMARLECLCRFHKTCISAWFVNHPGRCPVHQHDGFGF